MNEQLPPLPGHPEPHSMKWSELERQAINEYGEQCARAALAAKPCTCPSGDGSLRWPCPVHPAPAPEATELERMTAHRAAFFMERFQKEEKMLGPNEQAALRFVIAQLEAKPEAHQPLTGHALLRAWGESDGLRHGYGNFARAVEKACAEAWGVKLGASGEASNG